MASKTTRSTKWLPKLWERVYRGETLWVDEAYNTSPKWSWECGNMPGGRAKTRLGAMRAAERAVDTAYGSLTKGPADVR